MSEAANPSILPVEVDLSTSNTIPNPVVSSPSPPISPPPSSLPPIKVHVHTGTGGVIDSVRQAVQQTASWSPVQTLTVMTLFLVIFVCFTAGFGAWATIDSQRRIANDAKEGQKELIQAININTKAVIDTERSMSALLTQLQTSLAILENRLSTLETKIGKVTVIKDDTPR